MSDSYPTAVEGLKLLHASATDVGERRTRNEDSIGFFEPSDRSGPYLVVVADGVGGSNAGEVASQLAVETVGRVFYADGDPVDEGQALLLAMQAANDAIFNEAATDPAKLGMCTTCTCAAIRGNSIVVGHLGDCTAYMAVDGVLVKLTNDHSLAEEYIQQGREIPPDQAHITNVLTRWMGIDGEIQAEISEAMLFNEENNLVICSDGLTKVVQDAEILRTVSMHLPGSACRKLVKTAKNNGGPDNISLQVSRLTRF